MDEKTGLNLIEELKNDSEKFCKEGKSYPLLQEYFKGLSKDTLRELLRSENRQIRQTAMWITSELGKDSYGLLKNVVPHMDDDDLSTCFWALQTVANIARSEYLDDYIRFFSFLEHPNQRIRTSVMLIISSLSGPRIYEAYEYLLEKKNLHSSHEKGLLSLINVDAISTSEPSNMMSADDDIIRKYGAIAAKKLYKRHPQIFAEAANSPDPDLREFAKIVIGDRKQTR